MNARRAVTVAGVLAGAAIGATTLYVALKPGLRKKVRKAETSRKALALIGQEMGTEAREVADEMSTFMKKELRTGGRLPRRWMMRRKAARAAKEAANAVESAQAAVGA